MGGLPASVLRFVRYRNPYHSPFVFRRLHILFALSPLACQVVELLVLLHRRMIVSDFPVGFQLENPLFQIVGLTKLLVGGRVLVLGGFLLHKTRIGVPPSGLEQPESARGAHYLLFEFAPDGISAHFIQGILHGFHKLSRFAITHDLALSRSVVGLGYDPQCHAVTWCPSQETQVSKRYHARPKAPRHRGTKARSANTSRSPGE